MRSGRRAVAALSILVLLAAGCGDDDDGAGDTTTTAAAEDDESTTTTAAGDAAGDVQSVAVSAVDYEFEGAPEEITAGVVRLTFENNGEVDHEFALVEIGDAQLEEFITDFPAVLEGGPFPEYVDNVAAPISLPPGESGEVVFTVNEGEYALVCTLDGSAEVEPSESTVTSAEEGGAEGEGGEEEGPTGPPHFELGMVQTLTVTTGADDAPLPEADGTITARDYSFDVAVEAGDSTINYTNEGPLQVHFASISVFPEGTDAAAAEESFQTLLQLEEDQPPPPDAVFPEDVGFSGIFSAGLGATFQLFEGEFESGRTYAVACFIQDRAGGPPHAIGAQMYEVFTVE
jgi:uncharacterized cupredoxin-like copper-binding protein